MHLGAARAKGACDAVADATRPADDQHLAAREIGIVYHGCSFI
jgi:hypothetical protein